MSKEHKDVLAKIVVVLVVLVVVAAGWPILVCLLLLAVAILISQGVWWAFQHVFNPDEES